MRRVAILLFFVFAIGCVPRSTPTPVAAPTSIASCFPASVFTADEMRARVDWVGPVFVIHIPSVSEAVLDRDGNILFHGYKSSGGQNAIESILNHQELIARILQHAKDIGK